MINSTFEIVCDDCGIIDKAFYKSNGNEVIPQPYKGYIGGDQNFCSGCYRKALQMSDHRDNRGVSGEQ